MRTLLALILSISIVATACETNDGGPNPKPNGPVVVEAPTIEPTKEPEPKPEPSVVPPAEPTVPKTRPPVAEPPRVPETPAGLADTPQQAFNTLRTGFGEHDFSNFWFIMPEEKVQLALGQMAGALTMTLSQIEKARTSSEERAKRYVAVMEKRIAGRSVEELSKLNAAEQWALILGAQDAMYRSLGSSRAGIFKLLNADSKVVATNVNGDAATMMIENQLTYRRKRSEVTFKREGAHWRYIDLIADMTGSKALGMAAYTANAAKQKELADTVRTFIETPFDAKGQSGLGPKQFGEIAEIGLLAAPVAASYMIDEKATPQQKVAALMVVSALKQDGAAALTGIRALVTGDDEEVGLKALETLLVIGPTAQQAIPDLVKVLTKVDTRTSRGAAVVLGRMRQQPGVVVPALLASLEANPGAMREALQAISMFGAAAGSVVKPLAKHLDNDEPMVRGLVAMTLANLGPASVAVLGEVKAARDAEKDNHAMALMIRAVQAIEVMVPIVPADELKSDTND